MVTWQFLTLGIINIKSIQPRHSTNQPKSIGCDIIVNVLSLFEIWFVSLPTLLLYRIHLYDLSLKLSKLHHVWRYSQFGQRQTLYSLIMILTVTTFGACTARHFGPKVFLFFCFVLILPLLLFSQLGLTLGSEMLLAALSYQERKNFKK